MKNIISSERNFLLQHFRFLFHLFNLKIIIYKLTKKSLISWIWVEAQSVLPYLLLLLHKLCCVINWHLKINIYKNKSNSYMYRLPFFFSNWCNAWAFYFLYIYTHFSFKQNIINRKILIHAFLYWQDLWLKT